MNPVRYRTCRDIDDSSDPMVLKRIEIMPSLYPLATGKKHALAPNLVQP